MRAWRKWRLCLAGGAAYTAWKVRSAACSLESAGRVLVSGQLNAAAQGILSGTGGQTLSIMDTFAYAERVRSVHFSGGCFPLGRPPRLLAGSRPASRASPSRHAQAHCVHRHRRQCDLAVRSQHNDGRHSWILRRTCAPHALARRQRRADHRV